ncbi:MAG: non-ribosomal peptide synthetase [Chloroflexota bacterium]
MRDISKEIDALSPQKRAMFEALLQQKKANRAQGTIIPRRENNEGIPLSFAQQRLWFLDQIEPGNTFYNMASAVRLLGRLEIAVLEQSLNEIIRRHETLRTTFSTVEGLPVQVIAPAQSICVAMLDVQQYPEAQRESEAQRLAGAEAQRPFDLARGPLIRASLLRLDETHHILLLVMHHIISDGWSNGVLIREMAAIYPAFLNRQLSPLPELPVQYADYAIWQRRQTETMEAQLAYWKQQLAGVPNLNLPTDRPRPGTPSYRGARHVVCFSPALSSAINEFNRQEGVTLYMTILAALQTLLLRYTHQNDFAVGSPIAHRKPTEVENLIGFFFITLVMRANLSGNPTFRELLQRVRQTALDAYEHQDVPFEQIVDSLQLPRDLRQNPLFQVMLILQNMPMGMLQLPGVTIDSWVLDHGASQFDLSLYVWESEAGLVAAWQYNTDLFDAGTIARMAGHFECLLAAGVAHPERRLMALPILSEEEVADIVERWQAPQAPPAQYTDVIHAFEAQAGRQPDVTAVAFEEQNVSYRLLNAQANRLAHRLARLGAGPEVPVGLYLERSPAAIAGILGILKAGSPYLFLDPAYPEERTAFALNDARVPIIVTHQSLAARLPASAANVLFLEEDDPEATHGKPPCNVAPRHAAYIIYTSGSTGRPKGVVVERRSLAYFTQAAIQVYGLEKRERILQFASLSWDTSVEEIFPTLACGGTLVLRSEAMLGSTTAFWQKCAEWQVNAINIPTAYWHELVNHLQADAAYFPACLRLVIIGGERALPEPLKTWHRLVGAKTRLVNTYGTTEATAVTTLCELNSLAAHVHTVPIGHPLTNTRVYILDASLRPTPTGMPGELCIGGAGLSRGYLHRPELNAKKFLPDPFSTQPGARLYRTGDQARYGANGQIEFWGRVDDQIKIRGHRIEPGEIESLLRQHPDVQDAIVTGCEDTAGQKSLAAYVIANPQHKTPLETRALHDFLKERLPAFMLPGTFTILDAWPLTPSGKVARHALPAPKQPQTADAYTPPGTADEKRLAEIWQAVLGVEKVGIHDNFFELGGHSLLATQVLTRIRTSFQTEIPLRALFEAPTISALAGQLQSAGQAPSSPEVLDVPSATKTITAEEVDKLSDEQVAALLKELLDKP